MLVKNFDELINKAKSNVFSDGSRRKVAVMCADDEEVLAALSEAKEKEIAEAVLVGNQEDILKIANEHKINIEGMQIIDEKDVKKCGQICTNLINEGKASVMMKGLVGTADYMKAVLDKDHGLRTGNMLNHMAIYDLPTYHKILALSDAAINISPNFDEKVKIINNCVSVLNFLGIEKPKIAAIAAVEKVNPEKMPATKIAKDLSDYAKSGKLGDVFLDGPFGFDVAISKHAAKIKNLDNLEVPGDADLILADDIESANIVYKALNFFGQGKVAAIVCGAKVPLVLTSRSDDHETKFLSIVFAISTSK